MTHYALVIGEETALKAVLCEPPPSVPPVLTALVKKKEKDRNVTKS
jgi:hypothetical protein